MHLLVQGDREDRRNIKNADIRREKEQKAQRDLDERLLEARKLAGMGYSVEEFEKELKRIKMVRLLAAACIANNVSGIACIRLNWFICIKMVHLMPTACISSMLLHSVLISYYTIHAQPLDSLCIMLCLLRYALSKSQPHEKGRAMV